MHTDTGRDVEGSKAAPGGTVPSPGSSDVSAQSTLCSDRKLLQTRPRPSGPL